MAGVAQRWSGGRAGAVERWPRRGRGAGAVVQPLGCEQREESWRGDDAQGLTPLPAGVGLALPRGF